MGGSKDNAWGLLARIARVRWAALALAASYAVFGRAPGTSPVWLVAGVVLATALNGAVTLHTRLPRLTPGAMAAATVAADCLWIAAAAVVVNTTQPGLTPVIGAIALSSECALLWGWQGAAGSLGLAVGGLLGVGLVQRHHLVGLDGGSSLVHQAAAVAVSAAFAAVASAVLREQGGQLVDQSAALARHARTDHLTGLANDLALREAVEALGAAPYGLLLVDVDGMRSTNVVYGHQAGDEMLLAIARVLLALCRPGDLAVRLGEDEFVLLLPGAGKARAEALAEKLRLAVQGVAVSAGDVRICAGVAWSAGDDGVDAVLARADDALFAAKARGGDLVVTQGEASGAGRRRWRSAVESVLGSDRGVYPVYQAIVRVEDGCPTGWEALSRPLDWPADAGVEGMFLTAHRMGRGRDLDWRCRRNALSEASRLPGDLYVNVNLGALADPVHDVDQMLLLCDWAKRNPSSVVLELSERDAVPDLDRLRRVLAGYRDAGFRVAVDDVGQGQTTLELLLAVRPEFVKLAQPLVQAARVDTTARSGVSAMVGFAHDTGAAVVAEGVEDDADRALCADTRIDLAQGWLFGRPQPADRLAG